MIVGNSFIYIRVPRTASSSMESVLSKYHSKKYNNIFTSKLPNLIDVEKKHITVQELNRFRPDLLGKKYSFAFVRNPYDRIVSYFYYHYKQRRLTTFKDFVLKYVKNKSRLSSYSFWYKQSSWLYDKNGKMAVDFVGRYENLESDFNEITRKLIGIPLFNALPHLKKSVEKKPYEKYYTDELKEIVYQECKVDFDNFQYRKD